jgi:flagellar biogenesis protein FliO
MRRRALMMAVVSGLFLGAAAQAADPGLLPPRGSGRSAQKEGQPAGRGTARDRAAGDGWLTTLGGLAAVLALVFLATKVLKRNLPASQQGLPDEVIQVLGRKALDYRHQIHLVRCGSRMLVLGTSQEGMRTLCEISDRVEIDCLAGLCKASEPASVAGTFRQLLQRYQSTDSVQPDATSSIPTPESNAGTPPPVESDEDPAILQLQRRLQRAALGGGGGIGGSSTEAAG